MLLEVRKVYNGEIGTLVWSSEDTSGIFPNIESFTNWGNNIDFFILYDNAAISLKNNPTYEELIQGAGAVLDKAKVLFDNYNKPIIVQTSYKKVKYSWKGESFYNTLKIPDESEGLNKFTVHTFSSEDQARVIHAYFNAIKNRPWIIGFWQFYYQYWNTPNHPGWSIRGTQTEDVWRKWNEVIYE